MEKVIIEDKRPIEKFFWKEVPLGQTFYVRSSVYNIASVRTAAWHQAKALDCKFRIRQPRDAEGLISITKMAAEPPGQRRPKRKRLKLPPDDTYAKMQRDIATAYLWANRAAEEGYSGAHWRTYHPDNATLPLVLFNFFDAEKDQVWILRLLTFSEDYILLRAAENEINNSSTVYHKVYSYEEMIERIQNRSLWELDLGYESKKALMADKEYVIIEKDWNIETSNGFELTVDEEDWKEGEEDDG